MEGVEDRRVKLELIGSDYFVFSLSLVLWVVYAWICLGVGMYFYGCVVCAAFLGLCFPYRHKNSTLVVPKMNWHVTLSFLKEALFRMFLQKLSSPKSVCLVFLLFAEQVALRFPLSIHCSRLMFEIQIWLFHVRVLKMILWRTVILAHHLLKRDQVEAFLQQTGFRRYVRSCDITVHIAHAYCTGTLADFGLIMFGALRIQLLQQSFPFLLMELWCIFSRKFPGYGPELEYQDIINQFYRNHSKDHYDNNFFVFIHGSHHDAIPISVISAHGFWEACLASQLDNACGPIVALLRCSSTWHSYRTHQYVPGVFPFSKYVVASKVHHVEHHYFKLLPLVAFPGKGGREIDKNLDNYNPNNKLWAWFCEKCAEIEGEVDKSNVVSGLGFSSFKDSRMVFWDRFYGTRLFDMTTIFLVGSAQILLQL
jgi:hypothetical protein